MFRNSIVPVLLVVCWLSSMGESGVVAPQESLQSDITNGYKNSQMKKDVFDIDCSQFRDDLDVLNQLPFPLEMNPRGWYDEMNSSASMHKNETFVRFIDIHNEEVVPPSIVCLSKLERLSIRGTPLPDGTPMDVFTRFKQLRILSVSDIPLMKMTESLTKLTDLTALMLSNCSIKHLPNLSNLKRLEHLVLEGNGLSRLDGIPAVDTLGLHDEFFTEIPIVKEPLRLTHLSMINMPLKTVAPIISFINLETIVLSNATLKSIPTNIDKLQKLQYIDLSDNKLTHVPKSIFNLPDLELLLLDNNLLSTKDIQSIQEVFNKSHPGLILRL